MRVKTISVVYERKFNLGDFNSMTVGATAWADLDEGEGEEEAFDTLFAEVKEVVKEQSLPVIRQLKAKVQEVFAGLPVSGGDAQARRDQILDEAASEAHIDKILDRGDV